MKLDISLEQFRKEETFRKLFPNFILRVRDDSNDIAYYDGIKVFEVNGVKQVKLLVPMNTYKCNVTNVCENFNNEEDYLSQCIEICTGMSNYFKFTMSEITFGKAASKKYNDSDIRTRLERFVDDVKDFGIHVDINRIIKDLNEDEKSIIVFDETNDIEKIIKIQYYFLKEMKINLETGSEIKNTIKDTTFNVKLIADDRLKTIDDVDNFRKDCLVAISKYNGKDLLEKKYQHQFMLNGGQDKNIFSDEVYMFEQEYGITNAVRKKEDDKNKTGRVDCVFYQLNQTKTRVTDIYLIELKVNEDVVLGNNGVLTHLHDVQSVIDSDGIYGYNNYFMMMYNQIKYRLKEVNNLYLDDIDAVTGIKVHFYTVFGFTENKDGCCTHESVVRERLKQLEQEDVVNKLIHDYRRLDNYFENMTIYKVAHQRKDKYEIKFFFDQKFFDLKLEHIPECRDVTYEIYSELSNE